MTQFPTGWTGPDLAVADAVLRRLVERGWTPPDAAEDVADPNQAVRSLAEDLNVARLRAASARAGAARVRAQARDARRISEGLQGHFREHVEPVVRAASGLTSSPEVLGWALEHLPALTGADEVAVTLGGTLRVTSPDGVADRAEQLQVELGEGPTVDAAAAAATVATGPWPRWTDAAARLGVKGAVAVPMTPGHGPAGVLTVYTTSREGFDDGRREAVEVAAALLALCLGQVRRGEHLHRGMESRTVIGQGQGLLMERYAIDAGTAFALLRRLSSTQERPLHDVAVDLVRTRAFPYADWSAGVGDPPRER